MQIEFERTPQDIIDFHLYEMQHSAVSRRSLRAWRWASALIAAALGGGLYLFTPRYFNWITIGAALVAALVVFALYPIFVRWAAVGELRKLLREGNNDAILGRQLVRIAPEGIFASNRSGESIIKWSAVQKVSEGPKHLFLYTSALSALLIPTNCFKSEQDRQEFARLVETYRSTG
jgi:predicted DNA repair protein MutK